LELIEWLVGVMRVLVRCFWVEIAWNFGFLGKRQIAPIF
jgi:hypothetical protein